MSYFKIKHSLSNKEAYVLPIIDLSAIKSLLFASYLALLFAMFIEDLSSESSLVLLLSQDEMFNC